MQDIPTDTKNRAPSSRVLQEVIRQAPSEYVTCWVADIDLTPKFVRHNHAVSWTAGNDFAEDRGEYLCRR
jgi:hypothetical protein